MSGLQRNYGGSIADDDFGQDQASLGAVQQPSRTRIRRQSATMHEPLNRFLSVESTDLSGSSDGMGSPHIRHAAANAHSLNLSDDLGHPFGSMIRAIGSDTSLHSQAIGKLSHMLSTESVTNASIRRVNTAFSELSLGSFGSFDDSPHVSRTVSEESVLPSLPGFLDHAPPHDEDHHVKDDSDEQWSDDEHDDAHYDPDKTPHINTFLSGGSIGSLDSFLSETDEPGQAAFANDASPEWNPTEADAGGIESATAATADPASQTSARPAAARTAEFAPKAPHFLRLEPTREFRLQLLKQQQEQQLRLLKQQQEQQQLWLQQQQQQQQMALLQPHGLERSQHLPLPHPTKARAETDAREDRQKRLCVGGDSGPLTSRHSADLSNAGTAAPARKSPARAPAATPRTRTRRTNNRKGELQRAFRAAVWLLRYHYGNGPHDSPVKGIVQTAATFGLSIRTLRRCLKISLGTWRSPKGEPHPNPESVGVVFTGDRPLPPATVRAYGQLPKNGLWTAEEKTTEADFHADRTRGLKLWLARPVAIIADGVAKILGKDTADRKAGKPGRFSADAVKALRKLEKEARDWAKARANGTSEDAQTFEQLQKQVSEVAPWLERQVNTLLKQHGSAELPPFDWDGWWVRGKRSSAQQHGGSPRTGASM